MRGTEVRDGAVFMRVFRHTHFVARWSTLVWGGGGGFLFFFFFFLGGDGDSCYVMNNDNRGETASGAIGIRVQ